ncbi:MAG TPA: bacteriohemerythrin [Burkholderiales bacterium]
MITWDQETHGVGIIEMDQQHRWLADIINQMESALDNAADPAALNSILDELIQFTEFHFFTEEHYMRRHNYPDETSHREGHHHLVDQLLELRRDFVLRDKSQARSAIQFLESWLLAHIQHADLQLGYYLRSRGVK